MAVEFSLYERHSRHHEAELAHSLLDMPSSTLDDLPGCAGTMASSGTYQDIHVHVDVGSTGGWLAMRRTSMNLGTEAPLGTTNTTLLVATRLYHHNHLVLSASANRHCCPSVISVHNITASTHLQHGPCIVVS
jgi:hypothetical protein